MIASDYIICALATLMWNESHADSLQGMLVCGLLVRNRVLAGWEGQNWLKLIQEFDKHSANPPATPRVLAFGDPIRDDKFRRCLGLATSIYEGREKDITMGALRACRLNDCSQEFADKIVRPVDLVTGLQVHPRVAQVGQQACFK